MSTPREQVESSGPGQPESGAAGGQPAPKAPTPAFRSSPLLFRQQEESRSRAILLRIVRLLFFVMLMTVTVLTAASRRETSEVFNLSTVGLLFVISAIVGTIVVLIDVMTPHKRLSMVVAVYLGLCAGLIGALAVGTLLDGIAAAWRLNEGAPGTYVGMVKVIIGIVLCYMGVSVVLTTKDDFRLVIPYVEFAKQVRGVRPLLLDSSVLIDGRIEPLSETGFVDAPLIVPQFVIDEMQRLADSSDKLKRERGRRGLNVVSRLQASAFVDVTIDTTEVDAHSVDHMLLDLAIQQGHRILTNDYNLNKVAQIRGVTVLNINDLANALKAQVVPGQALLVQIIKPGESAGQGVGYLPDGTMVVVEDGASVLGQSVGVMVTNSLQTSAGRLIFGRLEEAVAGDGAAHSTAAAPEKPAAEESAVSSMAKAATNQPRFTSRPPGREEPHPGRNPRRM